MRLSCVQSNVVFGDSLANAANATRHLEQFAKSGTQFAVFPEAFLTGYAVKSEIEAAAVSIGREDRALKLLREATQDLDVCAVAGFAERTDDGKLYNTAVLLEKDQAPRFYRKTHLPELGLDRFTQTGNDLPVFETKHGRIGILICFDMRHPEAARVLMLKGADVIVLPTNWPEGAETSADVICVARAAENRVYMATCDRVGEEHGFRFIGRSKIIAPTGTILASAGEVEAVITADIDVALAREKRSVMIPGLYETTVDQSRRPELYGEIVRQ